MTEQIVSSDESAKSVANGSVLTGCRVIDFSTGLAGPYCTRLLVAAGATVIKVEPEDGDPMRRWSATGDVPPGETSAMFRFLNVGKQSVRGEAADARIAALLADSDILIDSSDPAAFDVDDLRERFPHLVVVSVTPFGRSGPWAGRPASDFTCDAEAGVIGVLGFPEGQPTRIGVRINEYIAGAYAATAALAAYRRAQHRGVGEHVDLSLAETAAVAGHNLFPTRYELNGRPEITAPARWVEVPGVEPTSDGWVGITLMSRQQFDDFLVMIDRSDLIGNEDWPKLDYRSEHMAEWNQIVQAWTRQHTTAEVVELASLFRIPASSVSDGKTVATFEQFVERGALGPCDDGSFLAPRPPIRIDGDRLKITGHAPGLGEHDAILDDLARERAPRPQPSPGAGRPLDGVRVLDATAWFAGPVCGQLLSALGAEVIHLDSHARLDGGRTVTAGGTDGSWWERGFLFHQANTGKLSLAVDMNDEAGRAVVKRVIAHCDLVIENFSPRVFDGFGLTWEAVSSLNPQASLIRLPAFGLDGPWRDRVGFGETMEQCSGMAWVTGWPDQPPLQPHGPCDPLAGGHGAFAALLALAHRDRTGRGGLVEVAMAETVLNAAAEPLVENSAYGRVMQRSGNRSAAAAPQGLYRCRGFENWLALTVATDEQWAAVRDVLGQPEWANDPDLAGLVGRRRTHDVIDQHIAEWAIEQDLDAVVEQLVSRGVPAGRARDPRLGIDHPQFRARHLYEEYDHPHAGRIAVAAIPFRMRSVEQWWTSAAPTLGQHNDDVLRRVAGLDEREIEQLRDVGAIGERPLGVTALTT